MIPFNKPPITGSELEYIRQVLKSDKLSGDGEFSRRCENWFETKFSGAKCLLTPSCTAALEMAAILIDVKPGDEIIMPSYTFVSTANAFVLRGAKVIFVDIRPDTMNLDETKIEDAITSKTKAIVPVHYAGVACNMEPILSLAKKYDLFVIEDAAQGMMSRFNDQDLGSIGDLGAFSFHDTKNYTSGGEGGLLVINNPVLAERAEVIREKGTNRSQFFRGSVDKYTWVDIGGSYLPSELQAAYLWGQLTQAELINENRLKIWGEYFRSFTDLADTGCLNLPFIPKYAEHNAHMFYLKMSDINVRTRYIESMKENGIVTPFHYVPLHASPAGRIYAKFSGEDRHTTRESERIVRLPIYYGMAKEDVERVVYETKAFFS